MKSLVKKLLKTQDWNYDSNYAKTRRIYGFLSFKLRSLEKYPQSCIIELTTRCDSKCVYCPRSSLASSKLLDVEDMPVQTYEAIIQSLVTHNPCFKGISFCGMGESLLYPYLNLAVEYARDLLPQTPITIFTNAITLHKHFYFIGKIHHLIISLNLHTPEGYWKLNQVDKFQQVVENAKAFLKEKGDSIPATQIQLAIANENLNHYKSFVQEWLPLLNKNDSLRFEGLSQMPACKVNLNEIAPARTKARYPCIQLFEILQVQTNGSVYPCCGGASLRPALAEKSGALCLGYAGAPNFFEVLDYRKLRFLRQKHLKGEWDDLPSCRDCGVWMDNANGFAKIGGKWR